PRAPPVEVLSDRRHTQVTTLWYSARSLPLAAYSFVAMPNWVTFLPLARLRISGSRVRRPVNRTLFTVHSPSRSADGNRADPASGGTSHGGRRKWKSRPRRSDHERTADRRFRRSRGRRSARPAWLAGPAKPSRDLCPAACPPRT